MVPTHRDSGPANWFAHHNPIYFTPSFPPEATHTPGPPLALPNDRHFLPYMLVTVIRLRAWRVCLTIRLSRLWWGRSSCWMNPLNHLRERDDIMCLVADPESSQGLR